METSEYNWNEYHSNGAKVLDKIETIKFCVKINTFVSSI